MYLQRNVKISVVVVANMEWVCMRVVHRATPGVKCVHTCGSHMQCIFECGGTCECIRYRGYLHVCM